MEDRHHIFLCNGNEFVPGIGLGETAMDQLGSFWTGKRRLIDPQ